eukprot:6302590-Amphidinium_carterae.1
MNVFHFGLVLHCGEDGIMLCHVMCCYCWTCGRIAACWLALPHHGLRNIHSVTSQSSGKKERGWLRKIPEFAGASAWFNRFLITEHCAGNHEQPLLLSLAVVASSLRCEASMLRLALIAITLSQAGSRCTKLSCSSEVLLDVTQRLPPMLCLQRRPNTDASSCDWLAFERRLQPLQATLFRGAASQLRL